MKIIETLKKAKIAVDEFATLCGVSRAMVYNWEKGKNIHPLRKPKVEKLLAAIVGATESGSLPLPGTKPRKNRDDIQRRADELKAVVIEGLRNLSATA